MVHSVGEETLAVYILHASVVRVQDGKVDAIRGPDAVWKVYAILPGVLHDIVSRYIGISGAK